MTTLWDDEFFMSGILCTNPGSKKNSFIFKSCVIFLNTIEKYKKILDLWLVSKNVKKNSAIQNILMST